MPTANRQGQRAGYQPAMTRAPLGSLDLRKFLETLRVESDRACAVLASSFLEAALEEYFRAKLIADPPARIFGPSGPLGTFAARIEMAFALGWISEPERADLKLVRLIGLAFAHDVDYSLTFAKSAIANRCFALQHSREFFDGADREGDEHTPFPWLEESRADPRFRFEVAVSFIRQAVVYRASRSAHATVSTLPGG